MSIPVPGTSLVLHRWRLTADGPDPGRRRRELIDAVVAPLFDEAVTRGDSYCLYACKYARTPPPYPLTMPLRPLDEVRVMIVTSEEGSEHFLEAVEALIPPDVRSHRQIVDQPENRLCWEDCGWYRNRMTDVTGVALDLHDSPHFDEHVRFLAGVHARGGLRAFTREALHEFFLQHSARYRAQTPGWIEGFWQDFLRWGPEPGMWPPGHVLENLLLVD